MAGMACWTRRRHGRQEVELRAGASGCSVGAGASLLSAGGGHGAQRNPRTGVSGWSRQAAAPSSLPQGAVISETMAKKGARGPQGSDHREGAALAALQLLGDPVGQLGGHQAHLFHLLAALSIKADFTWIFAAFEATGIVVLDQEADLAAGALGSSHG